MVEAIPLTVDRHGARAPTGAPVTTFATKLEETRQNVTWSAWGELEFLDEWVYGLGLNILVPFGRLENFQLGMTMRQEYGKLLNNFTEAVSAANTSHHLVIVISRIVRAHAETLTLYRALYQSSERNRWIEWSKRQTTLPLGSLVCPNTWSKSILNSIWRHPVSTLLVLRTAFVQTVTTHHMPPMGA